MHIQGEKEVSWMKVYNLTKLLFPSFCSTLIAQLYNVNNIYIILYVYTYVGLTMKMSVKSESCTRQQNFPSQWEGVRTECTNNFLLWNFPTLKIQWPFCCDPKPIYKLGKFSQISFCCSINLIFSPNNTHMQSNGSTILIRDCICKIIRTT